MSRLIELKSVTNHNHLSDLIYIMAYNVESALLESGAIPNEDYKILDLYKMAEPYALSIFNDENRKIMFDVAG